jgi:predicted ribosomally synthesized peptide with SipW-like signal peptide
MTRKAPSAKRSFIMSLTSLILCVAMLLGTTFAWFSETVSSGINTIKSGNLDVELEYYNAEAKKWMTVNGAEDIFNPDAKWEPGYTEVVYLKLSNLGSLAIKYYLGINIVDEVEGTNVAGQTFKLSNFIKYGVVEVDGENAFADRKAAIKAADPVSAALAAGYTENGHMGENGAEDDERIVAMVVYMPETVGNEANYAKDACVVFFLEHGAQDLFDLGKQMLFCKEKVNGKDDSENHVEGADGDGLEHIGQHREILLQQIVGIINKFVDRCQQRFDCCGDCAASFCNGMSKILHRLDIGGKLFSQILDAGGELR